MTFAWPKMLLTLISVPLLLFLYGRLQRRRQRIAEAYGELGLDSADRPGLGSARRHLPPGLFLLGLVILMVSAARPQMNVSLPRQVGTIILAFDVSGSMAANDAQPTRIEAAKTAARDFVGQQPANVDIGVVAFSDSGFSVQVPTNDQEAVLGAINRLAPQLGTSLANGIYMSLNVIDAAQGQAPLIYSNLTPVPTETPTAVPPGYHGPAAIVLLTDGENNENPDPLAAAQAAADRGVRIYTVGLGSPSGTTLDINGFSVHTQLDEQMLQQIADATGGAYYGAENEADLKTAYRDLATKLTIKPEKTEVTSIFAGAGALVLLLAGIISLVWYGRVP
jgi:Ca-activated chloride channel family protein